MASRRVAISKELKQETPVTMTQISRFIGEVEPIAQSAIGETNPPPAPNGGFADYILVSLHCLRVYFDTSYRIPIDLLKEMPQITEQIARRNAGDLRPLAADKGYDKQSLRKALRELRCQAVARICRTSAVLVPRVSKIAQICVIYNTGPVVRWCRDDLVNEGIDMLAPIEFRYCF